MADVRALMARERQARRITHEFASYNKSGALTCTACELGIKSESLWEGHLKSSNHRKNASQQSVSRPAAKRKIEDVDESRVGQDLDIRKKLKATSQPSSTPSKISSKDNDVPEVEAVDTGVQVDVITSESQGRHPQPVPVHSYQKSDITAETTPVPNPAAKLDEDEWAAFERDIAPLARADYTAATITSAPVTAAQIQAEAEADKRRLRDTEAEDEKEDEGRRIEEELEVMEEMEQRVRKLKEKRESLRLQKDVLEPPNQGIRTSGSAAISQPTKGLDEDKEAAQPAHGNDHGDGAGENDDDDDDDDAIDDWYS